jgi:hypothetical protein
MKEVPSHLHLYMRAGRLRLLSNSIFKIYFLTILTNIFKKIYNKKIELNIINLKYFYLLNDKCMLHSSMLHSSMLHSSMLHSSMLHSSMLHSNIPNSLF